MQIAAALKAVASKIAKQAAVSAACAKKEDKGAVVVIIIASVLAILLLPIVVLVIFVVVLVALLSGIAGALLGSEESQSESTSARYCNPPICITERSDTNGRDNNSILRGVENAGSSQNPPQKANAAYYIDSCIVDSSDGVYCFQTQPKQL